MKQETFKKVVKWDKEIIALTPFVIVIILFLTMGYRMGVNKDLIAMLVMMGMTIILFGSLCWFTREVRWVKEK